jgi:CheY-like chemotaxis protein
LALDQLEPASGLAEIVAQIESAASRAAGLTQQLLAYTGKVRLRVEPVELGSLVRGMSDLLAMAVPKHIEVRRQLAPSLLAVDGDANQLQQVVMNLVINAAEAIGERDGVITLSTALLDDALRRQLPDCTGGTGWPAGPCVVLEVCDTGDGMPADFVERIFDPFVSGKAVGRGLGLAAVQGIVRSHRGSVHVDSRPGRGTAMRVVLPAAAADREAPSRGREPETASRPPDCGQHNGKVLLVDDEASVRRVVGRMLEHLGYSVIRVGSGEEAIAIYGRHHSAIDIVLLDWIMPNKGGARVLRALRQIRSDVAVVLTSGYDEQSALDAVDGAGCVPFLQKPFDLEALAQQLAQVTKRT